MGDVHGVTSTGLVGEAMRVFEVLEWCVHHLLTSTDKLSGRHSIQQIGVCNSNGPKHCFGECKSLIIL